MLPRSLCQTCVSSVVNPVPTFMPRIIITYVKCIENSFVYSVSYISQSR
uniref:Uncharacterized protein n=1 Tax=Arundo donax TaxID=35708 RepID=A0A0A9GPA5_ARUDO